MILDGTSLKVESIAKYLKEKDEIKIAQKSLKKMEMYRKLLDEKIARGEQVYGITTGFGALAKIRIEKDRDMRILQTNLVRSHAAGAGGPMDDDIIRVAMIAKLNSLLKGNSCARPDIASMLASMLNKDILPVVPRYGSLGASGDLAPSAYMALAMIGEGKVQYHGEIIDSDKALRDAGLRPLSLEPKEGLSLLNGTCFTTAFACVAAIRLNLLLSWANACVALACEAFRACVQSFDDSLMNLRPIRGQREVAKSIIRFLSGSKRIRNEPIPQDPYSIRCSPQVHGAVLESLWFSNNIIEAELNSVTDNPVMNEEGKILHGGNFHAQPIAMVLDILSLTSTYLSELSVARIHKLMDKSILEGRDYLAVRPGLESGLMLTEYLAVALNNANSVLIHPSSSYPASVSAGVEDHASHGVNAGLKSLEIMNNVARVLAIELICLSNTLHNDNEGISENSLELLKFVRSVTPVLKGDRSLGEEIERLATMLLINPPPSMNISFSPP